MADSSKDVYGGKMSGKRGKGRSQLTFENTVSKILEDVHIKSMRISPEGMYEDVDDSGRDERDM